MDTIYLKINCKMNYETMYKLFNITNTLTLKNPWYIFALK